MSNSPRIDPHGDTWLAVKQHIKGRLEMHRTALETVGLSMIETESARAAIEELKKLATLAEGHKIPPSGGSG